MRSKTPRQKNNDGFEQHSEVDIVPVQINDGLEAGSPEVWPPSPTEQFNPKRTESFWHVCVRLLGNTIFGASVGILVSITFFYCLGRILPHSPNPNFPNPWLFLLPIPIFYLSAVYISKTQKIFATAFAVSSILITFVFTLIILVLEGLDFAG